MFLLIPMYLPPLVNPLSSQCFSPFLKAPITFYLFFSLYSFLFRFCSFCCLTVPFFTLLFTYHLFLFTSLPFNFSYRTFFASSVSLNFLFKNIIQLLFFCHYSSFAFSIVQKMQNCQTLPIYYLSH